VPDNRIHDSGFYYDPNGDLVQAPTDGSGNAWLYAFDGRGRLQAVGTKTPPSTSLPNFLSSPIERYLYDADGNRVFRESLQNKGKWTYFVRQSSSEVVSEWDRDPAASSSERKRYVYALGRAVSSGAPCGPPPLLGLQDVWDLTSAIGFKKQDVSQTSATDPYILDISTQTAHGGYETVLTPSTTTWVDFSVPKNNFSPNVTNSVALEGKAECGATGYSNEVSFVYSSGSCVDRVAGQRVGYSGILKLWWLPTCPPTTTFDLYFRATGTNLSVKIAGNITTPEFEINSLGNAGGRGEFWVVPKAGGTSLPASPHLSMTAKQVYAIQMDGEEGSFDEFGNPIETPTAPTVVTPWVYRFHHHDHLGSTRVETDERGQVLAFHNYYPFGTEIPPLIASDNSHRFTGHERDSSTGFDYMMARYFSATLARFPSPDSFAGSAKVESPQTWNRYSYVGNDPLNANDPTGLFPSKRGAYDFAVKALEEFKSVMDNVSNFLVDTAVGAGQEVIDEATTVHNGLAETTNVGLSLFTDARVPEFGYSEPSNSVQGHAMIAMGIASFFVPGGQAGAAEEILSTPRVASGKLQNLLNDLYKGTTNPGRIGNGTTADAIRHELATGQSVGGVFHSDKGAQYANGLQNWLQKNPTAAYGDRLAAQSVLNDLRNALRGKP
jgi:RHS repeat-associated protein